MWNCICNAYNCNKLSKDVYLYQITLENGLKCLHKFRYKSFNIGSWSLHLLDSHNRSKLSQKKEIDIWKWNITELHFFLVVLWQKARVTILLILWDGNDFQNQFNSPRIGLDWSWNEIWKSQLVTCFPTVSFWTSSIVWIILFMFYVQESLLTYSCSFALQ